MKLSSCNLACKCVFYRPEYNAKEGGWYHLELNFEDIEMQKWKVPTDRAQIIDEINGVVV